MRRPLALLGSLIIIAAAFAQPAVNNGPLTVVVFTGIACPVNTAYMPTLVKLHAEYSGKGVQFFAINSVPSDDEQAVAEHARKHGLPFPAVKDAKQELAEKYGADYTPQAFILDGRRKIRYRGRIDDQFGVGFRRPAPSRRDLAIALDELLAGQPVSVPITEVEGCSLAHSTPIRVANPTITYSKDVARIVQAKCQECHRPGQVGAMPLMTADDMTAWSSMIKRVVRSGRMPPWHADPQFGHFSNDRRLTTAEKKTLLAWIDQGCPPGDSKYLPPAKTFADGWRIGTPDVVITMPEAYQVPASAGASGVPYQYIQVPTHFNRDVWVQAAEARPGSPEVVHHIVVYANPSMASAPGKANGKEGGQRSDNLLVAHAPGDMPSVFAPGYGKKVPKGAVLLFQMHYTPDGTARTDRSSVGLILAKEPPAHEVHSRPVMNN
ncbi:MAG TPA: redoxin family protein, partial [Gemmataceae bacterium]